MGEETDNNKKKKKNACKYSYTFGDTYPGKIKNSKVII